MFSQRGDVMLGDKLYTLRKNRKISQEKFAEILNTSRQAVSKWERNEAKPDIDKLIVISKLFNVSIDYLLSYEIDYTDVEEFIDKLRENTKNSKFTISINDIKLWCSKYPNNFKLHIYSVDYLFVASIKNNNVEYLDLALSCINKAIVQYVPEYNEIVSLNDLHSVLAQIYLTQEKYKLAKDYVKRNNVYGCEVLLAKCNLYLKRYDDALKQSSEIYLRSVSNIMNVSIIQIMVLLKSEKIQEAFDLVNWSILFINSILKENDFFKNVLCPFIYLKATCERLLNIESSESIKIIKDIYKNSFNENVTSEANILKHYFGKNDSVLLIDSNIQNSFKEIIRQTSKKDVHYEIIINIYNEIFEGDLYE